MLDWSNDSSLIKSNCSGYEVLFWNPKTGKQVRRSHVITSCLNLKLSREGRAGGAAGWQLAGECAG